VTSLFGDTRLILNAGEGCRAVAALIAQERAATTATLRGLVGWVSKSAEVFRLHVDGTDGDLEDLQQSLLTTSRVLLNLHDRLVELKHRLDRACANAEAHGSVIDPDTYEILRRPPIPPEAGMSFTTSWWYADPNWRALKEFEDELGNASAGANSAWMDATYDLRALQVPFMESLVTAALGTGMLISALSAPETAITAVGNSRFTRHLSQAEREALQAAITDFAMPTRAEQRIVSVLAANMQDAAKLLKRGVDASSLPLEAKGRIAWTLQFANHPLFRRFPAVGAVGAGVGFTNDVGKYGVVRSGVGNLLGFAGGELASYGAGAAVAAAGAPVWVTIGSVALVGYGVGTAIHSWSTRGDLSEFQDHYLTVHHANKGSFFNFRDVE
jgi:hypothetical protein